MLPWSNSLPYHTVQINIHNEVKQEKAMHHHHTPLVGPVTLPLEELCELKSWSFPAADDERPPPCCGCNCCPLLLLFPCCPLIVIVRTIIIRRIAIVDVDVSTPLCVCVCSNSSWWWGRSRRRQRLRRRICICIWICICICICICITIIHVCSCNSLCLSLPHRRTNDTIGCERRWRYWRWRGAPSGSRTIGSAFMEVSEGPATRLSVHCPSM